MNRRLETIVESAEDWESYAEHHGEDHHWAVADVIRHRPRPAGVGPRGGPLSHYNITSDNRDDVVGRLSTMVLDAPADVFDAGRWWYHEAHDGAAEVARANWVSVAVRRRASSPC